MGFEPKRHSVFGRHMDARYVSWKQQKKKVRHPILLFSPDIKREKIPQLIQIVNIYEHTSIDFEFNMRRMIDCVRKYIGAEGYAFYAIGQRIRFRVVPDQEPMILPLIHFIFNYALAMTQILLHGPMDDWKPWNPPHFSNEGIMSAIDEIIYRCRAYNNHRDVCDVLAESKYLLNIFCNEVGDHLGYSISNNEFVEVAKRDKDVNESINCTFDIPKKCTPGDLEKIRSKRTRQMLDVMAEQDDLCISTYARVGLFNPGQLGELAVHVGFKPDLSGNTIAMTSKTNIFKGINDPQSHVVDARGGRKAEVLKKNVSDAGQFERSVSIMMSGITHVDLNPEHECNSKHFRIKRIQSQDDLHNIDGRVVTLDPNSDTYIIVDPRNDKYKLIGKTVHMKTPITCCHPLRHKGVICSACYGKLLSSINQDVHPGRLSALNDADEMEQKLLSAKHALLTKTTTVNFTDNFNAYFALDFDRVGTISFNKSFIAAATVNADNYTGLYLEFNPCAVRKMKDGEGRHFDRQFDQIVIYDAVSDTREIIGESNDIKLFLSPSFSESFYLPASMSDSYEIRIPIIDLIQDQISVLFEYEFKNSELADPLKEINTILNNSTDKVGVNQYNTFNDCLDDLMPKFEKGGIHVPDIHIEMMVACMIFDQDDQDVDWNESDPEYKFCSIQRSIMNSKSVITSLLYSDTNPQLDGAYQTYKKSGTSGYDSFLADV